MIAFTILLLLTAVIYYSFLLIIRSGLTRLSSTEIVKSHEEPFISVVIPFRDEEGNLKKCVEGLLNQDFPNDKFELIFVDDNSTDSSLQILEEFRNSKLISVLQSESQEKRGHKKYALEKGIRNARGEWIVTTDADCIHKSTWLTSLSNYFKEGIGFVSGPVSLTARNGFFNRLQNLEFSGLILTGAGLIAAGRPVICSGANLAVRKKAFEQVGGYEGNLNLSSGDDEFLMRKIARDSQWEVEFCWDKGAVVSTIPAADVHQFLNQRRRWASKGLFYESRGLILFLFTIFLFFLLTIVGIVLGFFGEMAVFVISTVAIVLKAWLEFGVLKKGEQLDFLRVNFELFFVAEILHIPYILVSAILGAFGNFIWKGRELKR